MLADFVVLGVGGSIPLVQRAVRGGRREPEQRLAPGRRGSTGLGRQLRKPPNAFATAFFTIGQRPRVGELGIGVAWMRVGQPFEPVHALFPGCRIAGQGLVVLRSKVRGRLAAAEQGAVALDCLLGATAARQLANRLQLPVVHLLTPLGADQAGQVMTVRPDGTHPLDPLISRLFILVVERHAVQRLFGIRTHQQCALQYLPGHLRAIALVPEIGLLHQHGEAITGRGRGGIGPTGRWRQAQENRKAKGAEPEPGHHGFSRRAARARSIG